MIHARCSPLQITYQGQHCLPHALTIPLMTHSEILPDKILSKGRLHDSPNDKFDPRVWFARAVYSETSFSERPFLRREISAQRRKVSTANTASILQRRHAWNDMGFIFEETKNEDCLIAIRFSRSMFTYGIN